MSRDHRKLHVFHDAHALVAPTYTLTRSFPLEERFGLQSQIRRAVVSVPTNIVEGCARRSDRDYSRFLEIAYGSSREASYLLALAIELGFLEQNAANALVAKFDGVQAALFRLIESQIQA